MKHAGSLLIKTQGSYTTVSEVCSAVVVPDSESCNIYYNWETDGQNNHITIQEWCAPHMVFICCHIHAI
jgi:hypothetical protein